MRKISIIMFLLLFNIAFAYEPSITKTVSGAKTLDAKETVFLSGQPIDFTGTLAFTKSEKDSEETRGYKYTLKSDNNDSLSRQLNFTIEKEEKSNGQIIKKWNLKSFAETVKIGSTTYTLKSYEISRNETIDKNAVGDFFAGNINLEKIYKTASSTVSVTGTGAVYGYDTNWAQNETIKMNYIITDDENNWSGEYNTITSDTNQTKVKYQENAVSQISFPGSYIVIKTGISGLRYRAKMPEFYNDKATDYREDYQNSYKYESFPIEERLANYNVEGITGHWAQKDIEKLFALEIMDEWKENTTPNTAVSRGEFAKILALTLKLDLDDYQFEEPVYKDVPEDNQYYRYIMALTKEGVVSGTGSSKFSVKKTVSRAEAITMIIKAIGINNKYANIVPVIDAVDAGEIPSWSQKCIYVAKQIGIISGNDKNMIEPNKELSKAEIASMSNRLIEYLTNVMPDEYSNISI